MDYPQEAMDKVTHVIKEAPHEVEVTDKDVTIICDTPAHAGKIYATAKGLDILVERRGVEVAPTTPTPWIASKVMHVTDSGDLIVDVVAQEDGEKVRVAQVYGGTEGQSEANADMLVKAVNCHEDLLAACKEVVDNWEAGDLAHAARLCSNAVKKAGAVVQE